MRFRNTLLALLLLAGLAVFIYYYEYKGEEQRSAAEESAKNLLTFERDKVEGIEVVRPGAGPLTLARDAGGWKISAPSLAGGTRADQDKVDSLLSTLGFLRVERRMEGIAESELDGFKLKDPAARVTLTMAAGQPALSVSLGDKAPVGGYYYATKPGSPDVLLVSGGVDPLLTADLATLRYKKVVGVDVWKVARFSLTQGARTLTLAHGGDPGQGEGWRLERPVAFPADTTKAQGLWFDLQSAEAESFETEQPTAADLDRLGLSHPEITLSVEQKEGAAPVTVAFGAAVGGARYARRSDMAAAMKVKPDLVDKLVKAIGDVDDLRDARVAPVERFKLAGIEIHRAAGDVTLVKDESSKWRWGGATGAELPSEDVNAVIDALEAARASGYLDQAAPPSGEPALTMTLKEGEGESARAVTVRVAAPGAAGAGRQVSSSATPTIYIVPPGEIQALVDKVSALKAPAAAPAAAAAPSPETPAPAGGKP